MSSQDRRFPGPSRKILEMKRIDRRVVMRAKYAKHSPSACLLRTTYYVHRVQNFDVSSTQ